MTAEERNIEVERLRLEIIRTVNEAHGWEGSWSDVKVAKEAVYKRNDPIGPEFVLKRLDFPLYGSVTAFFVFLVILYCFSKDNMLLYGFGLVAIVMAVVLVYRNKRLAHRIIINKHGVSFDEMTFEWQNIFQTYTVKEPRGRSTKTSLWMVLNDGDYAKMDISNYAYRDLGHYIEKYKRVYLSPPLSEV